MLTGGAEDTPLGQKCFTFDIRLHRYIIHFETDDRRIIRAVRGSMDTALWARGETPEAKGHWIRLGIRLSCHYIDPAAEVPVSGKATGSFENVEFHDLRGGRVLTVDARSKVYIDYDAGTAVGFVAREHLASEWIIAHRIFFLALVELLRSRGAYYVHAGCVCEGDNGILICGPSGGGKSTLTYALSRAGFAFLSDDGVFIREEPDKSLKTFSFPEKIKLDSGSCSFFEELGAFRKESGKREIALSDTAIRTVALEAQPAVLLIPVRSDGPASRLRPLPAQDALVGVLGQSIPLLTKEGFAGQLRVLTRLVETCSCFELAASRDFEAIADMVASVMIPSKHREDQRDRRS
jgi:hypothetical protein